MKKQVVKASTQTKHCSYFESLQNKLLEQTNTLTDLIDKTNIHNHLSSVLKSPPSNSNLLSNSSHLSRNLSSSSQLRLSVNTNNRKSQKVYIDKAKALIDKLKQSSKKQKISSPRSQVQSKDKYQSMRNAIYGLNKMKGKTTQQNLKKQSNHPFEDEFQDRCKKSSFKSISTRLSLKDTISSQISKQLQLIHQNMNPFFTQNNLDNFKPIFILGKGKYGSVCLVRHKITGHIFALKQIPHTLLCTDSKMLLQRIRQIKIQTFLDHPNIVQLYSSFIQNNNLYLLMQVCWGGNLYQHLKYSGPMPQQKIKSIVKQICYALEYMHDNDIIHRDLKPQNILFHQNIVKICDFGWAVYSPLMRNTLCGTPLYSSPQVVKGQCYDNKVDIWNLGILTYELLYGRVPFQIRHESQTLKVLEEQVNFPRTKPASTDIKSFISCCLCKNPRDRYPISRLIDHQFLNSKDLTASI